MSRRNNLPPGQTRDLRDEADHLPTSLADLIDLRTRVIEHGEPVRVANGVCGFVVAKAAGQPDGLASDTRARYRRILRELAASDGGPGKGGREGGFADILALVEGTSAAVAAGAAVSGHGAVAAVALASLYVTESDGDELDTLAAAA